MNPGNYKLPKPFSKNNNYTYYGYMIAESDEDAKATFEKGMGNAGEMNPYQSFDSDDRAIIAAEFNKFENEDAEIDMDSIDDEWINECPNSSIPVDMGDIIFESMEESMLAEQHIIICGMVENIKHFVMPLRAEHSKHHSPIVILHTELPTAKQWQQLQNFAQIYFVQGSPLNEKSYDRVNIMKAKQIVILSPNINGQPKKKAANDEGEVDETTDAKDEENLLDAKTIFKYNIIKKKNPNVNVVTELINQDNIAYLLDNPLLYPFMNDYGYDQTPVFASGEVYLSSLMDSLIC